MRGSIRTLGAVALVVGMAVAPLAHPPAAAATGPVPAAPTAAAAAPSAAAPLPAVTLVTRTTYDVLPAENRVAVTVAITATSHLRDTVTRQFYADRAYLAVVPTGSKFRLSAAAGSPSVAVASKGPAGTVLLLRFGSRLGAGSSLAMSLTFEIADPGGAPDRPIRISPSLVAFQAWALGTPDVAGSTVRVRLPADYAVVVGRGPLAGPTTEPDGHLDFDSAVLSTPATFVADILADRPGDLVPTSQSITVGGTEVTLLSRSWPDDPAWRDRVGDVLGRGLPALAAEIGAPWPLGPQLEVRETLPRAGVGPGGVAGPGVAAAIDPGASRLDVAYVATTTSILHGAARAWFNGDLVADEWIADGFADLYAEAAGKAIGAAVVSPTMTEAALAHAAPLNAWLPGGPGDDYGRAAALALARAIDAQAGRDALRAVWADAAAGIGAYQPVTAGGAGTAPDNAPPEAAVGPPDWRSLLDLLDAHASGPFDALWRRWVVRPDDVALLDARDAARRHYAEVVRAAGDWTLPRSVRGALRAWQFVAANGELDAATAVLAQRDQITTAAAAAGLAVPTRLRQAFEGTDGLPAAAAEAVTELAVIRAFAEAAAARPVTPGFVTRIGLLGTTPEADMAAAATAFGRGDLDTTLRDVSAARSTWLAAPDVARGRLIGAALLGTAMLLLAWLVAGAWRRRRPRPGP
ncbi:MAG: hypothetical protein HY264_07020 [Chloroflexi bacterium]|nr:hypothetical protein [Chloroflexota bacterium]